MTFTGGDDYVTGEIGNPYRRRRLIALSLALLLTAVVAVVIVVATADDDDGDGRRAAPSPSPTLVDSPSPEVSPTPEESAAASEEPSPSVSPTPTSSPSASPTPTRSATPSPTASPKRAFPPKGLVLEVVGEPITGDPPQVRFRIRVRDNDGSDINGSINFGDGTSLVYSQRAPAACATRPSEPPPGYRAQPVDKSYTVTHAYQRGGRFTVTVTANTDRQCEGTPAENARQTLIVDIPNRPTPSPTPSPSPISTPSPTASPSGSAPPSSR